MRIRASWKSVLAGALVWVATVVPAHAQLNTQHIKGTVGVKAGSQPPPHIYFIAPLYYIYSTDTVKDRNGDTVPIDASLNSQAFGAGISVVTTKKVLGGFYGYQVLFPVGANNRIQGTEIDANPGAGLTDSVVAPINLGWHFKRADALASYSIFVPTGRYSDGASNNTGFGMWGQELGLGTTVYLTENKQYHAATIATFDFQSKKEDSETKVGNAMNLEGGIGGDFLKGGLTVGLDYYASFKLSDDRFDRACRECSGPRQEQVFRARTGSAAGAREERHVVRVSQGELPMGDLREDGHAGERADDHGDLPGEAAEAADAVMRCRGDAAFRQASGCTARALWRRR